jgi:uncharacterized protein YdeI (YjbR/CyaY-like superfamily)
MAASTEPTLEPTDIQQWRDWLDTNGAEARSVWLVLQHKDSPHAGFGYQVAIEHALCFGWIDGLHRSRDEHSSTLRFTPRSRRSNWSALNRERATRMIDAGLMTPSGQAAIDDAKERGAWPTGS